VVPLLNNQTHWMLFVHGRAQRELLSSTHPLKGIQGSLLAWVIMLTVDDSQSYLMNLLMNFLWNSERSVSLMNSFVFWPLSSIPLAWF